MNRGPQSPVCSLPGCGEAATLQWQRRGTDAEARAHSDQRLVQVGEVADYRRAMLTLEIQDLHTKLERLTEAGGTNPRVLTAVAAQAEERQAELDAIEDPVRPLTPEPVTVAVFGCDEHGPDLEAASALHETGCLSADPCSCAL